MLIGRFVSVIGVAQCLWWVYDTQRLDAEPAVWWTAGGYLLGVLFLASAVLAPWLSLVQLHGLWIGTSVLGFALQVTTHHADAVSTLSPFWEPGWRNAPVLLCLLALVFSDRHAQVRINLFAVPVALLPGISYSLAYGELPTGIWIAVLIQYSTVAYPMLIIAFRRRMRRYQAVQDRWKQRITEAAAAEARLREERELSRVAHDSVLGVFNAAMLWSGSSADSQPVSPELRAMARDALTRLERAGHAHPSGYETAEAVSLLEDAAHVAQPGSSTRLNSLPGRLPKECVTALVEATGEAVRNSARHARGAHARVTGTVSPELVTLTIGDTGPGFDLTEIGDDRMGLRSSVFGRLQDLPGGEARIETSHGSGTQVLLSWRRSDGAPGREQRNRRERPASMSAGAGLRVGWTPALDSESASAAANSNASVHGRRAPDLVDLTFGWILFVLLSVPFVATCVSGGFASPGSAPLYVAAASGVLGSIAFVLPVLRHRRELRMWIIVACALGASSVLLLFGTDLYNHSLYCFGIQVCALLMVSANRPVIPAVTIAVLLVLAVVAALVQPVEPVQRAELAIQLISYGVMVLIVAAVWVLFAARLARSENRFRVRTRRAIADIQRDERESARLRLQNALADTGAFQAAVQLVDAEQFTPELQLDIWIAEATLRDYLRGTRLTDARLADATLAARRRGAEVLVLGEAANPGSAAGAIDDRVAARIVEVLTAAHDGDKVTLRERRSSDGSITLSLLVSSPDGTALRRQYSAAGEMLHES